MSPLGNEAWWEWKRVLAGLLLALLSLLVARVYLAPTAALRRPGLSLGDEEPIPPAPRPRQATIVAGIYLALAVLGFAIAALAAADL